MRPSAEAVRCYKSTGSPGFRRFRPSPAVAKPRSKLLKKPFWRWRGLNALSALAFILSVHPAPWTYKRVPAQPVSADAPLMSPYSVAATSELSQSSHLTQSHSVPDSTTEKRWPILFLAGKLLWKRSLHPENYPEVWDVTAPVW